MNYPGNAQVGKGLDQLVPEKKAKKCSYTANVSVYSECNVSANGVCASITLRMQGRGTRIATGKGGRGCQIPGNRAS